MILIETETKHFWKKNFFFFRVNKNVSNVLFVILLALIQETRTNSTFKLLHLWSTFICGLSTINKGPLNVISFFKQTFQPALIWKNNL